MRRVVVTGLGAVTPVGNDIPAFWENLLAGKNGIGPLSRFDAGEYKAKVAAQVKDFDPLRYLDKSDLRRTDLFNQYAVAASAQAMEDSGLEGEAADLAQQYAQDAIRQGLSALPGGLGF